MQLPPDWKAIPKRELEAWFLSALAADSMPLDAMLEVLAELASNGDLGRCESWAELAQEALAERGDREGSLRLLQERCAWRPEDAEFRAACERDAQRAFKDRLGMAMVKSAWFDAGVPLAECLRRLTTLAALKPGAFCHDRTWGFGVVRQADDFYLRVTVDFAKKPGHPMSLAYAGEALEVVGEDHLLARKHRDAAQLAALVRDVPSEVVRIALRSYGPMSAVRLKEVLVPDILVEAEWKSFWEAARKQLKADPLVDLPAGRSEPIRLLDRRKEYDAAWFEALAAEKDPQRVLDLLEELRKEGEIEALDSAFRRVLGERLAFAMWAADGPRPDLVVRLALAARAAGFTRLVAEGREGPSPADAAEQGGGRRPLQTVDEVAESMLGEDVLLAALSALPGREAERFLKWIAETWPQRSAEVLLALLDRLPASALGPVVDALTALGRETDCVERFAAGVRERTAGGEMLYWLATHPDLIEVWGEIEVFALVMRVVDSLDAIRVRERRKNHKQLCELFEDRPWLTRALETLSADQREALLVKVHGSQSWPEGDKRAVLAAMIRLYPELGALMTAIEEGRQRPPREARFTSWRTHRERQAQLRELVEKTIPENSREIGHARSYGDLRENFEYQAAKDRQRLLMRRKHELELDLGAVRGSDFAGAAADEAGPGTCVTIARADGRQERYCILGEWDRDEALGIIASRSKLAEALSGHRAGDEALLPGAVGEEKARIVEVTGLTDEIERWAAGK